MFRRLRVKTPTPTSKFLSQALIVSAQIERISREKWHRVVLNALNLSRNN